MDHGNPQRHVPLDVLSVFPFRLGSAGVDDGGGHRGHPCTESLAIWAVKWMQSLAVRRACWARTQARAAAGRNIHTLTFYLFGRIC